MNLHMRSLLIYSFIFNKIFGAKCLGVCLIGFSPSFIGTFNSTKFLLNPRISSKSTWSSICILSEIGSLRLLVLGWGECWYMLDFCSLCLPSQFILEDHVPSFWGLILWDPSQNSKAHHRRWHRASGLLPRHVPFKGALIQNLFQTPQGVLNFLWLWQPYILLQPLRPLLIFFRPYKPKSFSESLTKR